MKKADKSVNWKWTVLWSLWAARLVRQPTLPVLISSGVVRGSVSPDGSHRHYLGIPYATIVNRFQVADEDPEWEGIFEAVDEHVFCHQKMKNTVGGQEDCLVINVYTPLHATSDEPLPIMVYIHEGGFFFGSGTRFMHGPEYLVTKDVILVTFNYRIGVLGFLCLGIKEAPGNAGLKDQIAALKWVRRNIRAFGGDPDNVTIFGESAGAASVSFHMAFPVSKGLFHKAILQSGTAIAPWAMQLNPVYTASRLVKALGYDTKDPYKIYNILLNTTANELYSADIPRPEGDSYFSEVIFTPCLEKYKKDDVSFVTEMPYKIFQSGNYNKVPTIIGINSEEGYFFAAIEKNPVLPKIEIDKSLPGDMVFSSVNERKEVAQAVHKMYMGDENITNNILGYSRYAGEAFISYSSLEQTELLLNTSDVPVYSYVLNYSGWRNFVKMLTGWRFFLEPGATHADDLMFLFKPCMAPSMFEDRMIDVITTYWTNFAKYGEPNPKEWPPLDRNEPRSLILGSGHLQSLWYKTSLAFWRDLYQKYRRKSIEL